MKLETEIKSRRFVSALIDFVTDLESVFPYTELDTSKMTFKEQMEIGLSGGNKNPGEDNYDLYRYGKHIRKEKRHPKTIMRDFKNYSYDNYVERYEQILMQIQNKRQLRRIYLLPGVNFGNWILTDDIRLPICAHLKKLYKNISSVWDNKASYNELLHEMSDSDSDVETSDEEGELVLDKEFLIEGAKSLLTSTGTSNPELDGLIEDTVGSVSDTINNNEELKKTLGSMKSFGDMMKFLGNDEISSTFGDIAKKLGMEMQNKVSAGKVNKDNILKAGDQIVENLGKNMPSGMMNVVNDTIGQLNREGKNENEKDINIENIMKKMNLDSMLNSKGEGEKSEEEKERVRRKRQRRKERTNGIKKNVS